MLGKVGAKATFKIPAIAGKDRDSVDDRGVHGFGVRADGSYWLHWGDHVLILRAGQKPRRFSLVSRLPRGGEWGGADAYTAAPESLRIAVDIGPGRRFIDVPFTAIEKGAR